MATIDKIKKDIEKNNARIKEIQKKAKEQVAEIHKKLTAFLKAYAKGDITIPEEYLKEIEKMEDKKNAK